MIGLWDKQAQSANVYLRSLATRRTQTASKAYNDAKRR
jgi:hypothetical protein